MEEDDDEEEGGDDEGMVDIREQGVGSEWDETYCSRKGKVCMEWRIYLKYSKYIPLPTSPPSIPTPFSDQREILGECHPRRHLLLLLCTDISCLIFSYSSCLFLSEGLVLLVVGDADRETDRQTGRQTFIEARPRREIRKTKWSWWGEGVRKSKMD